MRKNNVEALPHINRDDHCVQGWDILDIKSATVICVQRLVLPFQLQVMPGQCTIYWTEQRLPSKKDSGLMPTECMPECSLVLVDTNA